jgi:hypothetical protein
VKIGKIKYGNFTSGKIEERIEGRSFVLDNNSTTQVFGAELTNAEFHPIIASYLLVAWLSELAILSASRNFGS